MSSPFKVLKQYQKVVLVTLTVLVMFAWGLGDVLRDTFGSRSADGENTANKVYAETSVGNVTHGELYTQMQTDMAVRNCLMRLWGKANPQMVEMATRSGFDVSFLLPPQARQFGAQSERDAVYRRVLLSEADRLGVVASDQDIQDFLDAITTSRANDGTATGLTSDEFAEVLKEMNVSGLLLKDAIRDQIRVNRARVALQPLTPPTPEQFWNVHRRLNEKRTIELAALPATAFLKLVDAPDPSAVQALFNERKDRGPFMTPQGELLPGFHQPIKVQLAYLTILRDAVEARVKKTAKITDQEIETYYNENKPRYQIRALPDANPDETPLSPELTPEGGAAKPGDKPADKPESKPEETPAAPAGEKPATPETPAAPAEKPAETPAEKPADKPAEPAAPAEKPAAPEAKPEEAKPAEEKPEAPKAAEEKPAECGQDQAEPAKAADKPDAAKPEDAKPEDPKPAAPAEAKPEDAKPATEPAPAKPDDKPATTTGTDPAKPADAEKPAEGTPAENPAGKPDIEIKGPEITPAKFRPLSEVSDEIRELLLREKVDTEMARVANELQSKMFALAADVTRGMDQEKGMTPEASKELAARATKALKSLARGNEVRFGETALVDDDELRRLPEFAQYITPSNGDFVSAELVQDQGLINTRIEPADLDGHVRLIWKLKHEKGHTPTLDEPGVREQVELVLKTRAAKKLALERAEALVKKAQTEKKTLAAVLANETITGQKESEKITIETRPDATWLRENSAPSMSFQQPLPQVNDSIVPFPMRNFMERIFDELGAGEYGTAINETPDSTIVFAVHVISVEEAPKETFLSSASDPLSQTYKEIVQNEQTRVAQEFWPALSKRFNITFKEGDEFQMD